MTSRRHSPSLGYSLTLNREPPCWADFQVDDDARDQDRVGRELYVLGTQFCQLTPAQARLDVGLGQQLHVRVVQSPVQALIVRGGRRSLYTPGPKPRGSGGGGCFLPQRAHTLGSPPP